MLSLHELFCKAKSDRTRGTYEQYHPYVDEYCKMFDDVRHTPMNVFEMGIGTIDGTQPANMLPHANLHQYQPGAGVRVWATYFDHPDTRIFAGDIDEELIDNLEINDARVQCFHLDQGNARQLRAWQQKHLDAPLDVIFDDASHDPDKSLAMIQAMWPMLKEGGKLIVESIMQPGYITWRLDPKVTYELLHFDEGGVDNSNLLIFTKTDNVTRPVRDESECQSRLHMPGIFHTQHTASFSHCAFTGKALRFPQMMMTQGFTVFEYSHAGSEGCATHHIPLLSLSEFEKQFSKAKTTFMADLRNKKDAQLIQIEQMMIKKMRLYVGPRDIVCHVFGHQTNTTRLSFPQLLHVETGIGYDVIMPDTMRIFETFSHMHHTIGDKKPSNHDMSWVIPNYYRLPDWPVSTAPGQYIAFLGRIIELKGMGILHEMAVRGHRIIVCGEGHLNQWAHPNLIYKEPISGSEVATFLSNAQCVIAPTRYVEPFCGSAAEGRLCGTPTVASCFGCFLEQIEDGVDGYTCRSMDEFDQALTKVKHLDRAVVAERARQRYSVETCGKQYKQAFNEMLRIKFPSLILNNKRQRDDAPKQKIKIAKLT